MTETEWRVITGYESYSISDNRQVRNNSRKQVLIKHLIKGCEQVRIQGKYVKVSYLYYNTFQDKLNIVQPNCIPFDYFRGNYFRKLSVSKEGNLYWYDQELDAIEEV